jgi:hypothetical protein
MSARRRFRQLSDLRGLQHAERDLAGFDHAEARARANEADATARRAAEQAAAVAEQWYADNQSDHFEPERSRALGVRLIVAEADALDRAEAARRATATCEDVEHRWRLSDARSRATDRIVRDARREIVRAEDEARLDQNAARVLDRWRQG